MRRLFVLALGFAACGRLSFEDVEMAASAEAGAPVDAISRDGAQDRATGGGRNAPQDGGTNAQADAQANAPDGSDAGGGTTGAGGAAIDAATTDTRANTGGTGGVASPIAAFVGSWAGTARNGGITYSIETSVANRAIGQALGVFFIPKFDCGGTTRLQSVGASLVYSETLLYDPRSNCGPAGTTTLTPGAGDQMNYAFNDGRKIDRGSLLKLSGAGPALSPSLQGVWMGQLTGSRPQDNRDLYLVLVPAPTGGVAGHFLSPQISCSGRVVVRAAGSDSLDLTLTPIEPPDGCHEGSATVRSQASNLDFTWEGNDGGSARGLLRPFF